MWEGRLPSLLLDSWIDLASDMRSRRSVARNCQRSSNRVLTSCCSRSRIPGMVEISGLLSLMSSSLTGRNPG